jgi:hypothetical protein
MAFRFRTYRPQELSACGEALCRYLGTLAEGAWQDETLIRAAVLGWFRRAAGDAVRSLTAADGLEADVDLAHVDLASNALRLAVLHERSPFDGAKRLVRVEADAKVLVSRWRNGSAYQLVLGAIAQARRAASDASGLLWVEIRRDPLQRSPFFTVLDPSGPSSAKSELAVTMFY